MSKLKYRAIIEDAQNHKCSDDELEAMFGIFELIMKGMMSSTEQKMTFNLTDFLLAKQHHVDDFVLTVQRTDEKGVENWTAVFERNGKKLKIMASVERTNQLDGSQRSA